MVGTAEKKNHILFVSFLEGKFLKGRHDYSIWIKLDFSFVRRGLFVLLLQEKWVWSETPLNHIFFNHCLLSEIKNISRLHIQRIFVMSCRFAHNKYYTITEHTRINIKLLQIIWNIIYLLLPIALLLNCQI